MMSFLISKKAEGKEQPIFVYLNGRKEKVVNAYY